MQSQDPVLNNASIRLGDSLRRTEDELTRNMLAGTAAFRNCVGGTNGNVPCEITTANVQAVTRDLIGNDGHMFLNTIEGEDKFNTAPVRNAYFALCHTDLTPDLEAMTSFIPAARYPNQQNIIDSEWGASNNLRFLVSSIGSVTPNAGLIANTDVYNIFCVAKEAYAVVEQDRYTAQFVYLPAQFSGPLAQNVTAGYKFASAYRILNDAWVINLRATLLNT